MSKITSDTIANALRKRYGGNEYAFMCEVRNATGFPGRVRSADAMAFSLWPSRGLEILGFEIKVSRNDWLKEKENPAKAEEIARHCDRWWMVAPVGLLKKEELPAAWGLLELVGEDKLQVTKDAPKLEPQEPKRGFWFSVMKEFVGQATGETQLRKQLRKAEDVGWRKGTDFAEKQAEIKVKKAEEQQKSAQEERERFEREKRELGYFFGENFDRLRSLPIRAVLNHIKEPTHLLSYLESTIYNAQNMITTLKKLEHPKLTCSDCFDANQDCFACHKTRKP